MTSLWWILIGGLLGLGLAGCVLPFLPGTFLILAAAIVHRVVYGVDGGPGWVTLVGLGLLAGAASVVDYLSGAAGARFFGSSKAGIWGAILGGIVGLFFSLPGLIIGPIVGAIAGELLAGRKPGAAGRAGLGTALGGVAGILIRLVAGIVMTLWFLFSIKQF